MIAWKPLKDLKPTEKFIILWVVVLTFLAGYMNAGAVCCHLTAVSHFTGNLTQIGISVVDPSNNNFMILIPMVIAFLVGAFISGIIFQKRELVATKRYGILLLIFGVILLIDSSLRLPNDLSLIALSCMMGAQNAMFISYRGMLIRTTHLTGYLTDAAVSLGRCIREKDQMERRLLLRRARFYLISILAFTLGAAVSTVIHHTLKLESFGNTLTVGGTIYILAGTTQLIHSHHKGEHIRRQLKEL